MSAFNNESHAAQLIDFTGLKWGTWRPTDVDAMVDCRHGYIFIEAKFGSKPVPKGQRILFQNLVRDLRHSGKAAFAIIARHNTPVGQNINLAEALVDEVNSGNGWHKVMNGITVKQWMDAQVWEWKGTEEN